MKPLVPLVLLVLLVTPGCQSPPQFVWHKPGASQEETQRAIGRARLQAMNWQPPRPPAPPAPLVRTWFDVGQDAGSGSAAWADEYQRKEYFRLLMQAEGYTLIPP